MILASFVLCSALVVATPAALSFEQEPNALAIKIDGTVVARRVWNDEAVRRPYFKDLATRGGVRVSRNHPPIEGKDAVDHPTMHPGLWMAFGELGGADFWRNKGLVRQVEFVEPPRSSGNEGGFTVRNRYEVGDKTVCEEVCRVRIRVVDHGYMIDWESTFTGKEAFAFGDQEEMGLGVRVHTPIAVKSGGKLTNAEGRSGEKSIWGRQADWAAYSGTVDGKPAGILILPDARNFRPSWFHARDYGLLVANPFGRNAFTNGEKSRVEVTPDRPLTLRFGIAVVDGSPGEKEAAALREWLKK